MDAIESLAEQLTREIATRARLEPEQVEPDAHFIADMGMSSLDLLSVLAFTEKTFATRFPDERLRELNTLNKVIEAIRTYQTEMTGERK